MEELTQYYKKNGLCNECKQPKTSRYWCRICNFQRNFKNWTSGNNDIDKFIQKTQLKAREFYEILEWIEYDRFENFNLLDWSEKLYNLHYIADGLNVIHERGLIHHDFHCGNILNNKENGKLY